MSKFKVGDKVVRTKDCGKDEHFLSKLGQEIYYTVTSVIGDYWLQVDGWIDGADKLPPVPRSVYYLKENGRRKLVAGINGDSVNVLISLRYRGEPEVLGYNMEPDAALQLAHDLRRMAMKIKREQK